MCAFITLGTLKFLKSFIVKHPDIHFYFMNNMYDNSTLAYYEHQRKKVFTAGKVYDIIFSIGTLQEKGFVAMETIPVTKDSQPLFEQQVEKQLEIIEQMPNVYAFRLLKLWSMPHSRGYLWTFWNRRHYGAYDFHALERE